MRIRIDSLRLTGTSRTVKFRPGLNVITGPISTGKTTLIALCRFLLGSRFSSFPPEVMASSSAVAGEVRIGDNDYAIVRTLVSTPTALVDIAGTDIATRLPAHRAGPTSQITYGQWLLERLGLPRLQVPRKPTEPDSEPTPVSINDYFLYCDLNQGEIDDSVFGHHDPYKNIKRKYVFQIIYGAYGIESALLHEQLREIASSIRVLSADSAVLERLLEDTPWSNRAELERRLSAAEEESRSADSAITDSSAAATLEPEVQTLRTQVRAMDETGADLKSELQRESASADRLEQLVGQLRTQSGRLARSIVADSLLLDFEFVVCPRCGSSIGSSRDGGAVCRLCLQQPSPSLSREDLIGEQQRIEAQVVETLELIEAHKVRAKRLEGQIESGAAERARLGRELDLKTRSFISDAGAAIARSSELRGRAEATVTGLRDYMGLFSRFDRAAAELRSLQDMRDTLEDRLAEQGGRDRAFGDHIAALNFEFDAILAEFNTPRFGDVDERSRIDPQTYLPVLYGRRFDILSSQGLMVLVNVAHALAHQRVNMARDLPLPNILFIDGLTANIGHREDLDAERVRAMYRFLISLCEEVGDRLQVIVADLDVPAEAQHFVVAGFSEADRLVPQ